jgi:hypothetical protein
MGRNSPQDAPRQANGRFVVADERNEHGGDAGCRATEQGPWSRRRGRGRGRRGGGPVGARCARGLDAAIGMAPPVLVDSGPEAGACYCAVRMAAHRSRCSLHTTVFSTARRCRSVIASRPSVTGGRKKISSWMSGARYRRFMI